jgi:hypothetical protein
MATKKVIEKQESNPRGAVTIYLEPEDKALLDSILVKSGDGMKKNAVYVRVLKKGMKEETRRGVK